MRIEKEIWGKTPAGEEILLYTVKNGSGASVRLTSVGAAIVVPTNAASIRSEVLGRKG